MSVLLVVDNNPISTTVPSETRAKKTVTSILTQFEHLDEKFNPPPDMGLGLESEDFIVHLVSYAHIALFLVT